MAVNRSNYFDSAYQWATGVLNWEPKPHSVIRETLFAHGPALPEVHSSPMSGMSTGSIFVISDITSISRATFDLASSIWMHFPNAPMSWMRSIFADRGMAVEYHAFGSVTGVNALVGLVGMYGGFKKLAYSHAIGDSKGDLLNRISIFSGGSLMGAGISYGAFRPLSIGAKLTDNPSLNHLANSMAVSGSAFYSLFFGFLAASSGLKMVEIAAFQKKLAFTETLEKKVQVLENLLGVDPKRIDVPRNKLIKEALADRKTHLRNALKELGIHVSREKLGELVYKVMEDNCGGWTKAGIQKNVEDALAQIGLSMRVKKLQLKKEAKLQRILDAKGYAAFQTISNFKGLVGRIQAGDVEAIKEANRLTQIIESSVIRRFNENAVLTAVCVLGIAAMILSVMVTGGVSLIVASAFMLALSLFMLGIDGYFLYQSYHNETPARHDKSLLILSTIVGMISLVGTVVLGMTGVVSMGTLPIVVSLVLTAIWMIQNGVTFGVINRNEKRFLENHPTIKSFIQTLDTEKDIRKIFANLPEEVKEKIQYMMKYSKISMKDAAFAVAKDIEDAKHKQLELLRKSFTTYLVN